MGHGANVAGIPLGNVPVERALRKHAGHVFNVGDIPMRNVALEEHEAKSVFHAGHVRYIQVIQIGSATQLREGPRQLGTKVFVRENFAWLRQKPFSPWVHWGCPLAQRKKLE